MPRQDHHPFFLVWDEFSLQKPAGHSMLSRFRRACECSAFPSVWYMTQIWFDTKRSFLDLEETRCRSQTFLQPTLGLLENVGGDFFPSSLIVISSSCPCLFWIETEVCIDTFSLLERAFRETRATINRFAYRRLERHHSSFATIGTFSLKHSFLERVESPLLDLDWNWKCKFSIVIVIQPAMDLKVSVLIWQDRLHLQDLIR